MLFFKLPYRLEEEEVVVEEDHFIIESLSYIVVLYVCTASVVRAINLLRIWNVGVKTRTVTMT